MALSLGFRGQSSRERLATSPGRRYRPCCPVVLGLSSERPVKVRPAAVFPGVPVPIEQLIVRAGLRRLAGGVELLLLARRVEDRAAALASQLSETAATLDTAIADQKSTQTHWQEEFQTLTTARQR